MSAPLFLDRHELERDLDEVIVNETKAKRLDILNQPLVDYVAKGIEMLEKFANGVDVSGLYEATYGAKHAQEFAEVTEEIKNDANKVMQTGIEYEPLERELNATEHAAYVESLVSQEQNDALVQARQNVQLANNELLDFDLHAFLKEQK